MDSSKSNVKGVIIGLLIGLFMAALDQTIVSTAMPTVIEQLSGLELFIWVYSAYLIAMVVATPIFGKLSDMYGRKRFFLLGLTLFVVGSMLCGTSQNMDQLIIYRAIQGLGGGAIMPIVFTIIFDLFPAEKRGKMTGLFGAVFGLSSVLGPIMGAYITDYIHWRWIFYINAPLGVVAFLIIMRSYREVRSTRKQSIDWLGAILLTATILCLMFGLELGGTDGWAWDSAGIIGLFAGAGLGLILFLFVETKAKQPIVPLGLFKDRLFTASQMISFLYGGVMIAGATYIPLFVQGVFKDSATSTGLILTPMMLGVVASSMAGGFLVGKFAFRNIMVVSGVVLTAALVLLGFTMDLVTPRYVITLYMVLVGLGIGVSFSVLNISTLNNIEPQNKGTATAMVTFFRSIGTALGITVLGALQKHQFQSGVKPLLGGDEQLFERVKSGQELLSDQASAFISPDLMEGLLGQLGYSIIDLFKFAVWLPLVALVFAFMMGRARVKRTQPNAAGGGKGGPSGQPEPSFHGG